MQRQEVGRTMRDATTCGKEKPGAGTAILSEALKAPGVAELMQLYERLSEVEASFAPYLAVEQGAQLVRTSTSSDPLLW